MFKTALLLIIKFNLLFAFRFQKQLQQKASPLEPDVYNDRVSQLDSNELIYSLISIDSSVDIINQRRY